MNNTIKASVIIPCFNRAQVLSLTLIALNRQNCLTDDYEIIIVDDGSTDQTGHMVNSLAAPNIKLIRTENKGPASARNTGAREARGEILIFLDSDFITRKSFLTTHLKAHSGENNLLISGMGHWHYIASFDYKDEVPGQPLKDFFDQLRRTRRVPDQTNSNALISEAEVVAEQFDSYLFRPKWLDRWGYESIIQVYGETMAGFQMPWLASCTGNLSISRKDFERLAGFDENLRCFEDWEFGLRFQKAGGKLRFKEEAEAFQQICPPDPDRETHERIHYNDFLAKHPDLGVGLLSILNTFGLSFRDISEVISQQSGITDEELQDQMKSLVFDYALERSKPIRNRNDNQVSTLVRKVKMLDEVSFGAWKKLFLQLAISDASERVC